mgnify:CR=1 FL=1
MRQRLFCLRSVKNLRGNNKEFIVGGQEIENSQKYNMVCDMDSSEESFHL